MLKLKVYFDREMLFLLRDWWSWILLILVIDFIKLVIFFIIWFLFWVMVLLKLVVLVLGVKNCFIVCIIWFCEMRLLMVFNELLICI